MTKSDYMILSFRSIYNAIVTREGSFWWAATLALRLLPKSLGQEITDKLETHTLNVVSDVVQFMYNPCRTNSLCWLARKARTLIGNCIMLKGKLALTLQSLPPGRPQPPTFYETY